MPNLDSNSDHTPILITFYYGFSKTLTANAILKPFLTVLLAQEEAQGVVALVVLQLVVVQQLKREPESSYLRLILIF